MTLGFQKRRLSMGRTTLKWEDVIQFEEVKAMASIFGEMAINFITLLKKEE